MLTEDQRMQMMYTGLVNCFCTERALAWSRSQLLTVVNLAGLPILVAQQVPIGLRYFIGGLGVALCVFWLFVNWRMRTRINYWYGCLARMEPPTTNLLIYRIFTGKESETIRKPPRIYAVNLLPWMFAFVWITVSLIAFLP